MYDNRDYDDTTTVVGRIGSSLLDKNLFKSSASLSVDNHALALEGDVDDDTDLLVSPQR